MVSFPDFRGNHDKAWEAPAAFIANENTTRDLEKGSHESFRYLRSISKSSSGRMLDRFKEQEAEDRMHCFYSVLSLGLILLVLGSGGIVAGVAITHFALMCAACCPTAAGVLVIASCLLAEADAVEALSPRTGGRGSIRGIYARLGFLHTLGRFMTAQGWGIVIVTVVIYVAAAVWHEEDIPGPKWGVVALILMIPLLLVQMFGGRHIFDSLVDHFSDQRLLLHGALVAKLRTSVHVKPGQEWWVHHGQDNSAYPILDPRRNWEAGIVAELNGSSIGIQLQSRDGEDEDCCARRCSEDFEFDGTASDNLRWITLKSAGVTTDDILGLAKDTMRCIDWVCVSDELLKGAICGNNADVSGFFNLSRKLRPGEQVDFFLSHSWRDNAASKMSVLEAVVEEFRSQHGRDPTFWIDKACIDQRRVEDCLTILPVHLTSCSKVLVLLGHTYMTRVNCIWELFVLLSSPNKRSSANRLEVHALHDDEGHTVNLHEQLEDFSINNAHCYDPNEEDKLKAMISTLGTVGFEEQFEGLAARFRASC
mmetsp:Transcript_58387/g.126307  ORF Transcript_58387/g.126307 Transcript_58387/m.126307 type:complete len:536 (+) Transcript_58387:52-1659(+)